jgi:hypothetical protein
MPWIERFRPRVVDAAKFDAERQAWQNWHEEQTKDEAVEGDRSQGVIAGR